MNKKNPSPYPTYVSENILYYMKKRKMGQQQLVQKCKELGYQISQPTISNAIHGQANTTISTLSIICAGLDINLSDLFVMPSDNSIDFISENDVGNNLLITNPKDPAFAGFLNDYFVYFYQTSGDMPNIVNGTLSFSPSADGDYCCASLKIPVNSDTSENISYKKYNGQLIISKPMRTAYCQLYSKTLGEYYQIYFRHWYILNNSLKCTMACALTTCSGSNRRPTLHRICLSKAAIDDSHMKILKSQLLLNDGNIILSHSNYHNFLQSESTPEKYKTLLKQNTYFERCIAFKESTLLNSNLSIEEKLDLISSLRVLSTAQKYNKVSKRTEDILFSLYDLNYIDQ